MRIKKALLFTSVSTFAFLGSAGVHADYRPNPADASTTSALKTLSTTTYRNAVRNGYYTRGDVPWLQYKAQNSACSLNGGLGDDASQIRSADGKCWIAMFHDNKPNVRQFGAKGDGVHDDAPAFRAACAWALRLASGFSNPVYVPSGYYVFKSLEADGNAALNLNTGLQDGMACSLEGPRSSFDYPFASVGGEVYPLSGPAVLKLGDGMNRPLLRHKVMGASAHVANLTLDGNGAGQTGWAGGPSGLLFTVQEDDGDFATSYPETGIIFDDVVTQFGYNGNLLVGAWRFTWANRFWSMLSGQTIADSSVWVRGYDSIFYLPAIGGNVGSGIFFESGAQLQVTAGAIWSNGHCGIGVGGLQVNYLTIAQTNIQYNDRGICNSNAGPFVGGSAGGVTLDGVTFDGNITSDVYVAAGGQVNRQMKLVAPNFTGSITAAGVKPTYNVESPGGVVEVTSPAMGSGGSFTTAFASVPENVFCTGGQCPSTAFTPILGNGSPTYTGTRQGYAMRSGSMVHAQATVTVSNLGGATGQMFVGNFPWYGRLGQTGYVAGCTIAGVTGWTAPATYDWLTASISFDENFAILRKNSKSGAATAGAAASEFGASTSVTLSCDYIGSF